MMMQLKLSLQLERLSNYLLYERKEENRQGLILNFQRISEGTYSNLAIINSSSDLFLICSNNAWCSKRQVKSRIVMTPEHAKKLVRALNDNISKYESNIKVRETIELIRFL